MGVTTTAIDLLRNLRQRGISVTTEGGAIGVRPSSRLSKEDIEALRARKAELLAILQIPEDAHFSPEDAEGAHFQEVSIFAGSEQLPPPPVWPNTLRAGPPPRPSDAWLHAVCLTCSAELPHGRLFYCHDECRDSYFKEDKVKE